MPSPVPDTHPYERQIVRAERETSTILAAALEQMRQQVWRGITADNVREVLSRLQSRDVNEALAAAIMRALDPVAQMGVEHGRASVEQQIFGVKAAQTAVDIGFDWTLANTAARVNLQQHSFNLYYAGKYSITAATERALRGYIDQFIDTGGGLRDLEQQVAYLFGPDRAEDIAITEVTRAYALGNLAAWEASGVVGKSEWRTARDELVCPICAPLHGKQAALGETFDGIVASPPAHPKCRCSLAPVVDVPEETETERENWMIQDILDDVPDPFENIRPPWGRAPRGQGQEYKDRRAIVSRINTQMRFRGQLQSKINRYRGQQNARWDITHAQARVAELNKAIDAALTIAADQSADWSFKRELIDDLMQYVSDITRR